MDMVWLALGIFFAIVFGFRFIWFVLDYIGKLFWNLSGVIVGWSFAILLFIVFAASGIKL